MKSNYSAKIKNCTTQQTKKAKKQLGFAPQFSNQDALFHNFHWHMENQKFEGKSGVSHRVPWKQGILGLVKHLF